MSPSRFWSPPPRSDLISLDELKIALGLPTGAGTSDAQLEWLIDVDSSTISTLCNRSLRQGEGAWRRGAISAAAASI